MRVLVVHNRYRSKYIGGEDGVFEQEVKALGNALGDENVFVYEVCNDELSRFTILFSIFWSFRHYNAVRRLVRARKIDIVHVHNFFPMLTPSIFFAAKSAGAKVVHTLHNYRWWCIGGIFYTKNAICERCPREQSRLPGIWNRCYRSSYLQSALAAAAFGFYRKINAVKPIDAFFTLTPFQQKKVLEMGIEPGKVFLKPNFVETPEPDFGDRHGYVYIGRLEASKGIKLLLETWKSSEITYKLTVIGSGPMEKQLREYYGSANILFLGQLSKEEVYERLKHAKYLIQPSLWYETFGLTMIEAMKLGIPVIGFTIGTRNDLIVHGYNGFLTHPEKLDETLRRAETYENYEEMQRNAIQYAASYDVTKVTQKQIEIYKSLL